MEELPNIRVMAFAISTTHSATQTSVSYPGFPPFVPVRIEADGALTALAEPRDALPLFCGAIHLMGPIATQGTAKGLGIFSDLVIFPPGDGNVLSRYAAFRGNAAWHACIGASLEPDTTLIFDGRRCHVLGTGGVTFFRPLSGPAAGLESELTHYKQGSSFDLSIRNAALPRIGSYGPL